jgi:hypothetical protein
MTDLALSVPALRRALFDGTNYADAFNAVIDAGASATAAAKAEAIRALLADLDGARAVIVGELAVASGALVEQGGSPTESLGVLLDALATGSEILVAAGPALDDANLDRGEAPEALAPAERGWVRAFRRIVVGMMARLARSVGARKLARAHPRLDGAIRALADRISAWHLSYIVEVLDMLDDAPLVLVDTEANTVTRLRADGIRNCFHLLTLLEGHDPFALTEETLQTKRGYYTWRYLAVATDRAIDQIQTMIPGDLRAVDIPQFDGTRVVVRTPHDVHRMWDMSFVSPIHDALHSTITVENTLSESDARALVDRMRLTTDT